MSDDGGAYRKFENRRRTMCVLLPSIRRYVPNATDRTATRFRLIVIVEAATQPWCGELIEVNPEATPLSEFATQRIRKSAAVALPKIVDQVITS